MAANITLNERLFNKRYYHLSFTEFEESAKYWLDKDTLEIHAITAVDMEIKQTKVWVTLHLSNSTTVDLRLPGNTVFGADVISKVAENPSTALPIYRSTSDISIDLDNHQTTLTQQRDKYQYNLDNKTKELADFTAKYSQYTTINAEHLV